MAAAALERDEGPAGEPVLREAQGARGGSPRATPIMGCAGLSGQETCVTVPISIEDGGHQSPGTARMISMSKPRRRPAPVMDTGRAPPVRFQAGPVLEQARLRGVRRRVAVVRCTRQRRRLLALRRRRVRCALALAPRVRPHPRREPRSAEARWFGGSRLNYAEHALRAAANRPGHAGGDGPVPDAPGRGSHLGGVAGAGGSRPTWAAGRRSARRGSGCRLSAQHSGGDRRHAGRRQPGSDLDLLRPRDGRRRGAGPPGAGRARGAAGSGRLPLRRSGPSTAPTRTSLSGPPCPRSDRRYGLLTWSPSGRLRPAGPTGGPSPPKADPWSSSRSSSTIRCTCCTRRAPPASPRPSCTGTAASCSSTPRRWPGTSTSDQGTSSSGSRRRAG